MAIVKGPFPLPKLQQEASKGILRVRLLPTLACFESMTSDSIHKNTIFFNLLEGTLKKSFESIILLNRHPRMVIDIYVHILGADSDLCMAATVACSGALAQSKIQMLDLLVGFSFSKLESNVITTVKKDNEAQNTIYLTYAPTIQKYSSIYGIGAFKKPEFLNIDSFVKMQSEFLLKILKKALLLYVQG